MTTYTRKDIDWAVDDIDWMQCRIYALKGEPTAEKLRLLRSYYEDQMDDAQCIHDDGFKALRQKQIRIQVDNYLKALARGGFLYPGVSLEQALAWDWNLRVKK